MDKMKKIIIYSIIITIVIISLLLIILYVTRTNDFEEATYENGADTIILTGNMEPVTNATMFYTVEDCVQKYLTFLGVDYEEELSEDAITETLAKSLKINNDTDKREAIYDLLDIEYINNNKINTNNIYNYVRDTKEKMTFLALNMTKLDGAQVQRYVVYGNIKSENIDKNSFFIVSLDNRQGTFMIEPIEDNKYQDISEIYIENNYDSIEKNDRNKFSYNRVDDAKLSKKYFEKYMKSVLENIEEAYNSLDEQYRQKRFGSLEEFSKYINKNRKEIEQFSIKYYKVNKYDNYNEYVCKDQYENLYIFKEIAIMDYTLTLDSYTIDSEEFIDQYEEASNTKKVMMNIDKFVQMINNRDYKSAYNCLDEGYKANYFQTEEEFESYMRERFPLHYKIQFAESSEENDNIYVQKAILTDITENISGEISVNFIMKLEEGTNFVMSFSENK